MKKLILVLVVLVSMFGIAACSPEYDGRNRDDLRKNLSEYDKKRFNNGFEFLKDYYKAELLYQKGVINLKKRIFYSGNMIIYGTIPPEAIDEAYINEIGDYRRKMMRGLTADEIIEKAADIRRRVNKNGDTEASRKEILKLFESKNEQ